MVLEIRPIRWHWQDWVARHRALDVERRTLSKPHELNALMSLISRWTAEANAYLGTLDDGQRQDVIDLVVAECDMLWQVIYPAAHAPSGYFPDPPTADDRLDFRERFYTVQPLVALISKLDFPHVERAQRALADLDRFATSKNWLP